MQEFTAVFAITTSLIMAILMFIVLRQQTKMWRDVVIYLRSKTAYEAEDAIDRQESRNTGVIKKQLDKMRKEKENLRREPLPSPEDELRQDMGRAYEHDPLATKPLP